MKFSVIVPAYNAAAHIGRCLDSLAAQTFDADGFEVIVANDASTDTTVDVAAGYERVIRNFTLVHAKQRRGPGAGRNLGIAAARGEWVLFLDSDDRLLPDALASLANFLLGHP